MPPPDRTAMARTGCCRRFSVRLSHTTVHMKTAWHGPSTAARCSITSGSSGSGSIRRRTASDSMVGCAHPTDSMIVVTLPLQLHVVHEGGQLAISRGRLRTAPPLRPAPASAPPFPTTRTVELLDSRHVPDRSRPDRRATASRFSAGSPLNMTAGASMSFSGAAEHIKDEGDPNYLSRPAAIDIVDRDY